MPLLVAHFLSRADESAGVKPAGISKDAMDLIERYNWPGNVRELRNAIEHAVIVSRGAVITPEHLPWNLRVKSGLPSTPAADSGIKLDETLETIEKRLIRAALKKTAGNATRAAALLGIWRTRLLRRMEALGIEKADEAK